MSKQDPTGENRYTRSPKISKDARWMLGSSGVLIFAAGVLSLLWRRQDGAATSVCLACSLIAVIVAVAGELPRRVKIGDNEIEFREQLEEQATKVRSLEGERPKTLGQYEPPSDDITRPLFSQPSQREALFALSPTAALLAQFGEMEEQIRGLANDVDLPDRHRHRHAPLLRIVRELQNIDQLDKWHFGMVEVMTRARNTAAHAPSTLTTDERENLREFIEGAAEVAMDVAARRDAQRRRLS